MRSLQLIMNNHIDLLSKINHAHWSVLNPYFSNSSLNQSMRAGLTNIKKCGFLTDFNPQNALDYVSSIDSKVKVFDFKNPDYDQLGTIFDLIQAWGGQTGRTPYVKKNNSPHKIKVSRLRFDEWKEDYLNGARSAKNDRPVTALKEWVQIDGLGASFSPKHLRFWTNKYPVLDTRISLLLCGSKRLLLKPDYYDEFLSLITILSNIFSSTILETEKALFAFSQNYFINEKLNFKDDHFTDKTDYEIAELLATL